MGIDSKTE